MPVLPVKGTAQQAHRAAICTCDHMRTDLRVAEGTEGGLRAHRAELCHENYVGTLILTSSGWRMLAGPSGASLCPASRWISKSSSWFVAASRQRLIPDRAALHQKGNGMVKGARDS